MSLDPKSTCLVCGGRFIEDGPLRRKCNQCGDTPNSPEQALLWKRGINERLEFLLQRRRFIIIDTKDGTNVLGGILPRSHSAFLALEGYVGLEPSKKHRTMDDLKPHESILGRFRLSGVGVYKVLRVDDVLETP